jgi:hypothetical protein
MSSKPSQPHHHHVSSTKDVKKLQSKQVTPQPSTSTSYYRDPEAGSEDVLQALRTNLVNAGFLDND